MAPDLSAFTEEDPDDGRMSTVNHWAYAALNVGVYSALLQTTLAVPVTAFKLAVNQTPVFDTDARLWVWEYASNYPTKGPTM